MDDLIRRQDALDLLNVFTEKNVLGHTPVQIIEHLPSAQPTVDAVEVVRCRDCKHYAGDGMYCANDIIVKWDYFFCYDGEREDDD